ncbi:MAG: hypothetical protein OER88_06860 [Planctomycetota bacterium]|nr:hypothetical protein [Planctomycetota bacterium]
MKSKDSGFPDGIERLLRSAPRHDAPRYSVEQILERGRRRRRRAVGYGAAVAAVLLCAAALSFTKRQPPVHLQLEFVDAPREALRPGQSVPAELFGP